MVKLKMNTTALSDMWEQINLKCEEWAGGIHIWGARGKWVDKEKSEEDINNQGEDQIFQAKAALIYGFSEETVKKLKKGSLVEVVITMAKMGLKGDCTTKRRTWKRGLRKTNTRSQRVVWESMEGKNQDLE